MGSSPVPILHAHWGNDWIRGSERCLLDLIGHLDHRRYAPVVLCNSAALASAVEELRVPVLLAPRFRARDAFMPEWRLVADAWHILRQYRIKLIHVNNIDLVKCLLPAARMAGIPLVAHVHLPSPATERRYTWAHQVSRVIAVSRAVAQDFLDDGLKAERVEVIYNAVDPDRLNAGDASALRAQLGIHPDEVVVVAVGSLIHRKGFDILLRAFARVRTNTGVRLLILGDGPDRGATEALAVELGVASSVFFLGERQDVGAIFRDVADIAASAARVETFGLTLIEAALFGVPVAASGIPPHREAVLDGQTGLLAVAEDPDAFASVLTCLINDSAIRRRLGDAGRRRVRRNFSSGGMCGSLPDVRTSPGEASQEVWLAR